MARQFDRKIVLENGREFYGYGFGAKTQAVCEIVFNTSVVGYQEILSDPGCTDQMVVMTYPVIGNYGLTDEDYETRQPMLGALVVREYNDNPSNFRYTKTVAEELEETNIPAIEGIDTRALTRLIRDEGTMKALICDADLPYAVAMRIVKESRLPHDSVRRIGCKKRWYSRTANARYNLVAVDCGIKLSLIREMNRRGCNVTIVPCTTTAEEVLALKADGVLISSGPSDPRGVPEVEALIMELRGKLPIFGIGLGYQLICRACGANTRKMKVGHRGSNHPVREMATGKITMVPQNHSYTIDIESLIGTGLELTYMDILDNTAEGVASEADRLFGVQFTPVSTLGTQDPADLYDHFIDLMDEAAKERSEHNA